MHYCLYIKVAFGEVRGKNDALANSFQISSYPSLVFFCDGDAGVSFPYEVSFMFSFSFGFGVRGLPMRR